MNALKHQLGYLLYGLIAWFPIGMAFFVASIIFASIDTRVRTVLGTIIPHRFIYTGVGFVFAMVIIYVTGIVLQKTAVATVLRKIPVLGMLFGKTGAVMSLNRLLRLRPCLFLYTPTCPSYGWVLSEESARSSGQDRYVLVNVYYPNVPTMFTGQIYPVRKEAIILLNNTSSEVLDLLLYSLRSPASLNLVPWDGESSEQFNGRVTRFGLSPVIQVTEETL